MAEPGNPQRTSEDFVEDVEEDIASHPRREGPRWPSAMVDGVWPPRQIKRKVDALVERVEAHIATHPPAREELGLYAMTDGVQPYEAQCDAELESDSADHAGPDTASADPRSTS